MIISCEKCNKKFELDDKLIPENGRLLQCGSCSYQWHYSPKKNLASESKITLLDNDNESTEENIDLEDHNLNKNLADENEIPKKKINLDEYDLNKDSTDENKVLAKKKPVLGKNKNRKKINFFNFLLAFIISIIALIVLLDTTKSQLSNFVPNIDFYLSSLYESIRDIFLFFKDLTK